MAQHQYICCSRRNAPGSIRVVWEVVTLERTEYKDAVVEQPPRLLRLAQVAQMLQVHPKTVYYWVPVSYTHLTLPTN